MVKRDQHTISSGIVKDVLLAIAGSEDRGKYLGGGLSLQFDLPERYHRPTTDVDLNTKIHTSYSDFKNFIETAFSHLIEAGYTLNFKKGRSTFDAYLERDDNKLMIQIPNRSKKNYENMKSILEREFEHRREKDLPRGKIDVISLEDLVVHKIIRAMAFTQNYGLKIPNKRDLGSLRQDIEFLREGLELSLMGLEPEEISKKVANIRLYADIFDMMAVIQLLENEIDENYLAEAASSFRDKGTLKEKLDFFYSLT